MLLKKDPTSGAIRDAGINDKGGFDGKDQKGAKPELGSTKERLYRGVSWLTALVQDAARLISISADYVLRYVGAALLLERCVEGFPRI
jgi:hypothetical protein